MEKRFAENLVRRAKPDPEGVLRDIAAAPAAQQQSTRALVAFAHGRALFELARNAQAVAQYQAALADAEGDLHSRITISLAAAQLAGGQRDAATNQLEHIESESDNDVVVQLASCQLALIELGAGDVRSAKRRLQDVVPVLESDPEELDAAARALGNLAYCEMTLGNLEEAADLYRRTIEIARASNETLVEAGCLQNLAYIHVLRGQFPDAISGLREAEHVYLTIGAPARNLSSLYDDMAETFALAGLSNDAVEYARTALELVSSGANIDKIAEAQLQLARCLLDAGNHEEAGSLAQQAGRTFLATDRPVWAGRAVLVEVESSSAAELSADLLDRAAEAAERFSSLGWHTDALRISNAAAFAMVAAARNQQAQTMLATVAPDTSLDAPLDRLEQILHHTIHAEATNTTPQAFLDEARVLLQTHQLRLADPELRAGVGRLRSRFRATAIRRALHQESPLNLLKAEESWRALGARLPQVAPPNDPHLAELSQKVRQASNAAAEDPADGEKTARLHNLEKRLRHASITLPSRRSLAPRSLDLDLSTLADELGERVFLEWLTIDHDLHGLAMIEGQVRHWRVSGSQKDIGQEVQAIHHQLRRLLRPGLSEQRATDRWRLLEQRIQNLGNVLLPIDLPQRPRIVLSPTAELTTLPFAVLLPLATSVQATLSASSWMEGLGEDIPTSAAVVVGPGLPAAAHDARAVKRDFAEASTFLPPTSDSNTFIEVASQVSILHVAAHCLFRDDSPLLSSIQLTDGHFTLYELPADSAPDLVTLAACDAGQQRSFLGGETVGMISAWLAAGSRTVIAPSCPVPDTHASTFATNLYHSLRNNSPDEAVAKATQACNELSPIDAATAAAFQTWGFSVGVVSNEASATQH